MVLEDLVYSYPGKNIGFPDRPNVRTYCYITMAQCEAICGGVEGGWSTVYVPLAKHWLVDILA